MVNVLKNSSKIYSQNLQLKHLLKYFTYQREMSHGISY